MQSIIPPIDPNAPFSEIKIIGQEQGWLSLAVNFTVAKDGRTGATYKVMQTAWEPTPAELARLNAGGKAIIQLVGWQPHPPIAVWASDPPTEETP